MCTVRRKLLILELNKLLLLHLIGFSTLLFSFIIVSSSPICRLIVTFLILSFLNILQDFLEASISVASTRLLLFSLSLHVSAPNNKLLLISTLYMFNFLLFLMSFLQSIPFKLAIHFLACITLELNSLSSVPLVSKITPKYLHS